MVFILDDGKLVNDFFNNTHKYGVEVKHVSDDNLRYMIYFSFCVSSYLLFKLWCGINNTINRIAENESSDESSYESSDESSDENSDEDSNTDGHSSTTTDDTKDESNTSNNGSDTEPYDDTSFNKGFVYGLNDSMNE